MLTKVEISTDQGATLELPLKDPSSGYLIKDIQGLDPVKATIVSSNFASLDGEQYQASRREARNITIKLGLDANYTTTTTRDLRKRLYNLAMPKSRIRLRFFVEDEPTLEIYGVVESFDSPTFTKEPEADISLLCHLPDFYNPESIHRSENTVSTTTEYDIMYEGTVETGLVFVASINRNISGFSIQHRPSDGVLRTLQFSSQLIPGDIVTISTVPGSKFAVRTRAGLTDSVLYDVSPYSTWIELHPGSNKFRVFLEGAPVPYTIEYTEKFGAI